MALLFADEDFPFPAVLVLRSLGHDVMTTDEAGLADVGTPDPDILAEATRLGRGVLTMNRRDFIDLHAVDPIHAGIVVCTRDADVVALAGRIHLAILTQTTLGGQLIRINRPNRAP